ncbi:MAG TPA: tRNA (adenosine(37)-N6)-threonylcarbamoyltransferase complex dimerization subunit type 1 TsaB [Stellaceae bacterium]
MTSDKRDGPILLAIETAGSACSVAVGRSSAVLAAERQAMRYGHGEALLPMIDRVVMAAGLPRSALDGIAVAVGPGGFTGIRVGLAAARGIALALGARLIGVTSFDAVAAALPPGRDAALIALDSRRDDLYVQLFDRGSGLPLAEPAAVLPDDLGGHIGALAQHEPLLIAGDMVEAAAAALGARIAVEIAEGSAPDAGGVLVAALRQIERAPSSDPVRPLYLRPPDVTLPKQPPPVTRR